MARVRIYISHPSAQAASWTLSVQTTGDAGYAERMQAVLAACDRARALEELGDDVTVLEEDADGHWQIVRE
jgi:hypothetical protein